MTPELWAALIGAVVLCLGGITTLVKVLAELARIKADRLKTKAVRDEDSQKLHDDVLKHGFEIANLKGTQTHHGELLDDLRNQISTLNCNIVELNTNLKNILSGRTGERP